MEQVARDAAKQELSDRLIDNLPKNWFNADARAVKDPTDTESKTGFTRSVVSGLAELDTIVYEQNDTVWNQIGLLTAVGTQVDAIARDYFGTKLPRYPGEQDLAYKARIRSRLLSPGGTRAGMIASLELALGTSPVVVEEFTEAGLTGGYMGGSASNVITFGSGGVLTGAVPNGQYAYNTRGAWGKTGTAFNPNTVGVIGYNVAGQYGYNGGTGLDAYEALITLTQPVVASPNYLTKSQIYSLIEELKPMGTTIWTRFNEPIPAVAPFVYDMRSSFVRASIGWWNGTPYAINRARIVDPSNSGIRGVLVEEGTTQNATRTQEFDNVAWTKTALTITANSIAAPDDTLTADKFVETATTNDHYAGVSIAASKTLSFYAKAGERSLVWCNGGDGFAAVTFFNLATGTVAVTGGGYTATITAVPDRPGWYRCTATKTTAVTTINLGTAISTAATSYAGDGTSGAYLWGAQGEDKAYATTYVPNAGATAVTRAAETLTVPTSGLLVPSQGSVIVKHYLDGNNLANPGVGFHSLFRHATANFENEVFFGIDTNRLYFETSNQLGAGGVTSATALKAGLTGWAQGWKHTALSFSAAELSGWFEGVKVATAPTPNRPTAFGNSAIGYDSNTAGRQINAPIALVIFYNRALTAAEHAAVPLGNYPPDFTAYFNVQDSEMELTSPLRMGYPLSAV